MYIDQILSRSKDLINCGIWADLHPSRLLLWMNNFITDQEKYFGACVLDTLIYRSQRQIIALIKQLFQRSLPDLTRLDPTPFGHIEDWENRLSSRWVGDPGVRLVAAVQSHYPPGKSAHLIARLMMQ
jgi:hypothetical protein